MQHYFLSPILVYEDRQLKVAMTRALVSANGIYKVFEESEEVHRAFLSGKHYKARVDGVEYTGRLVRESGPSGTHYNLHLFRAEGDHLKSLLARYGFASPWKRDFARLPAGLLQHQVEVPINALLTRFSGQARASVRNFSYHGLFLELRCSSPSIGEVVGHHLRFRIQTSRNRLLGECSAVIARIYDEMEEPGKLRRGLGLRITDMPDGARKAYHDMILEGCRELQGGAREE